MERYADVLVPLPVEGTFTYRVPAELDGKLKAGHRVLVPFGSRKFYTAVVVAVHSKAPAGYEVKEILRLLDPAEVVRFPQVKFWNWLADYYLCTRGEVYKAALPAGLRVESETYVRLNPDFDPEKPVKLTERQSEVVAFLKAKGRATVKELDKMSDAANVMQVVTPLMAHGIVEVDERAVEKYRPVSKTLVRLCCDRYDDVALHEYMEKVKRAAAQTDILMAYLTASDWLKRGEPLRDVEKAALIKKTGCAPGTFNRLVEKGIMEVYKSTVNRFNDVGGAEGEVTLPKLSEAQGRALKAILDGWPEKKVTLLHGVTGSGKTEIYTHLIKRVLGEGMNALYLVPEISLTTQLTDRLRRVFGDRLLVYHSKFSDSERVDLWMKLYGSEEPLVVLGARSAVFLPFRSLGLVVVDEEHESSYKQYDPAPRYNARDAAIVLASMHAAPTVLGSATPSVETYYKAVTGKYGLVELPERYSGVSLPEVEIVDMKAQRKGKLNRGSLSSPLMQRLTKTLDAGRQTILFQNRRGFAPMVMCRECGWVPKCTHCDVSLVYHKATNRLRCHYCGHNIELPAVCPACGQNGIETFGYGTERIAEEVHSQFPKALVARMDLDTTRNKHAYQEIIDKFAAGETDVLVGTQMVSKGLDFERVDVVGVINADTLLNYPDFRSDERAFNMLEQVSGRAGRREDTGTVVIQTTDPRNDVLEHVRRHDFSSFYSAELENRRRFAYPPFTKIINIYLRHRDRALLDVLAVDYTRELQRIFGTRVLGPERPYVSKIANMNIQTIMLKVEAGASMAKVKAILRSLYVQMSRDPRFRGIMLHYDVDPV